MLTTFLETGNGIVVVDGIEPQPFSGLKGNVNLLGPTPIAKYSVPRDANGTLLNGVFSGEFLIQAQDVGTGDTFTQLLAFTLKHFGGASTVVASSALYNNANGSLAGSLVSITVDANGDFNFNYDPVNVLAFVNVNCIGILIVV